MRGLVLLIGVALTSLSAHAWAESDAGAVETEALAIRQQASRERGKEEELQMMRLELERLKLQGEMRKAAGQTGGPADGALTVQEGKVPVKFNIKSIAILSEGAKARIDAAGQEVVLEEKGMIAGYQVKSITPGSVTFISPEGKEVVEVLP